jgi:GTPase SAR1 family protein
MSSYKVVVMGAGNVGKTCLIVQLISGYVDVVDLYVGH